MLLRSGGRGTRGVSLVIWDVGGSLKGPSRGQRWGEKKAGWGLSVCGEGQNRMLLWRSRSAGPAAGWDPEGEREQG